MSCGAAGWAPPAATALAAEGEANSCHRGAAAAAAAAVCEVETGRWGAPADFVGALPPPPPGSASSSGASMQRQCTATLCLQEYSSDSYATETAPRKAIPKDGADTNMGQKEVEAVMGAVMGAGAEADAMEVAEDMANTLAVVEAVDNFEAMGRNLLEGKHTSRHPELLVPRLTILAQSCVTPKQMKIIMKPCMRQGAAYPSATTPYLLM
jgi:hypothetical protein